MPVPVPTFPLSALREYEARQAGVFFLGPDAAEPHLPIFQPYRSAYYKVGLCLQGHAELRVNFETYVWTPGSLLLLTPHPIRQWLRLPPGFAALSYFFTSDFLAVGGAAPSPEAFVYFGPEASPVLPLPAAEAGSIRGLLELLGQQYVRPHAHRPAVLRHLTAGLLYEVAAAYEQLPAGAGAGGPARTRAQLMAARFRRLLHEHGATERHLGFYADRLCVTAKHLAETVKATTGRRATEWLAEAVLLEAKVRLRDPALTVGQVADQLHFADQSACGRFFKKHTRYSPAAYRQHAAGQ